VKSEHLAFSAATFSGRAFLACRLIVLTDLPA
jgi:hypothetical protein